MKLRHYLTLFFFMICLISIKAQSQQDTLYYNLNWKETVKDSAAFFRPPVKKEGDLFRVEDYYASGQLQMSGLSKKADRSVWQGKVSWYTEDGKLSQEGNYVNSRLDGEFVTFYNTEKLVAMYKDGRLVGGTQYRNQLRNNYYTEIKNDTIIEIIFDKDINGVRYENYSKVNKGRFLSKYYDEKGELIGELKILDNGYTKGEEVFYYYEPMRIRQIRYYPFERLLGETVYYPNRQIRTEFEYEPDYKKTFYSNEGIELGSVTYLMDYDYLKPNNGTEYFFSYGYKDTEPNTVVSLRTYNDSKLVKEELRYTDGKVKSVTTYKDNVKELQISYNEKGEEIARMVYQNYYPLTGTEITGNKKATYKDGELIKETNYYSNTKIVFSEVTKEKETYFDKKGNVLGTLEIDYQNKYAKPIKGKRFYAGYDSDISSIETYNKGFLKERTTFRTKLKSEKEKVDYKRTEYYEDNGYNKIRAIDYYSNGSKQSDIEYKGYDKMLGKFYNEKDELIGNYDYVAKDGTLYEFFPESDVISLVMTEVNGVVSKLKRYDYGPYRKYGDIDAVLMEEIDASCCSKSYNRNGDIFTEATYKDGKPWEGTIYDQPTKTKFTIKEGKRNGTYEVFDYNQEKIYEKGQFVNDKKEGIVKKYSYIGKLESIETYKNDKLNGETSYYDKDEKKISTLTYKNGDPFEGTKIVSSGYNKKPIEETYSNGIITKRISYDDNGKRVSKYKDGKETETIAYHENSDKKRLSYKVGNYYINGEVIRYDKNGKEQHRAMFKNNKLESGIVYLTSRDTYDKRVAYVILNKQEDKISVTMKNHEDNVVFFAEENLEKGYVSKYINKLNLYIDNLTPESLY
ncbi:hypothetical protein [uncultured Winogradskyella sp.]|uniref:toxin-antitoxin system YwqK family antitoxin n=1 Tax=uncultured Winogradskyella sp. TaxID=395353 RepID=UPI00261D1E14|nr:hypothetical protein [uncultured Winogradskyella sp.]